MKPCLTKSDINQEVHIKIIVIGKKCYTHMYWCFEVLPFKYIGKNKSSLLSLCWSFYKLPCVKRTNETYCWKGIEQSWTCYLRRLSHQELCMETSSSKSQNLVSYTAVLAYLEYIQDEKKQEIKVKIQWVSHL